MEEEEREKMLIMIMVKVVNFNDTGKHTLRVGQIGPRKSCNNALYPLVLVDSQAQSFYYSLILS
jgi:hypothetical protein